MDKPDVDSIEGLSPAISIDQKTTTRNPRSTVGTVTEIYDYLRLLYARVGHPHCPVCGKPIAGQSAEQIVDQVLALPEGTRFTVDAPMVRGRKGEFKDLLEHLRADGFTRARVDGEQRLLEEPIELDKQIRHTISVIVDRLVIKEGLRARLTDSIETALRLADGLVEIASSTARPPPTPRSSPAPTATSRCPSWRRASSRSTRRTAPARAAPASACSPRSTPTWSSPTLDLSIAEGALVPWTVINSNFYEQVIQAIADRYEIDLDTPWRDLPDEQRDALPARHRRREAVRHLPQPDGPASAATCWPSRASCPASSGAISETDSAYQKERIEEYMTLRPCPECQRRAAEADQPGGHGRRHATSPS